MDLMKRLFGPVQHLSLFVQVGAFVLEAGLERGEPGLQDLDVLLETLFLEFPRLDVLVEEVEFVVQVF